MPSSEQPHFPGDAPTPETPRQSGVGRGLRPGHLALGNLDLVLLAAAFVIFLIAGWPLGGWLTAAGIWAMWRGIGWYSDRKAAEATDPKRVVGIATGSMIGRGWLMALILVSVGLLTSDEVGLSAAVLSVVLFTAWFTTKMILRPFEPGSSGPGEVQTP